MSLRRRRRRRRTDTVPVRSVLIRAIATLGAIGLFVAFAVTVQEGVPTRDYGKMFVSAPESGSLRGNDRVAIGGVRVGQVVDITPQDGRAHIELQLDPGLELPEDTSVRLRANGLLGARFVQLIPGSSRTMLKDGATIRGRQDALTESVPDTLDVLDAETRGALGKMVSGLGQGMLGNGSALNEGVRVAADATVPFTRIMDSILARGAPERLVPSLNAAAGTLSDASVDIKRMLAPTARALRPLVDRREALRETLEEAPGALAAARGGTTAGTRLLAATGALADAAHRTLPTAPPGLRQATALMRGARTNRNGDSALQRTTALLEAIEPAVPAALDVTSALRPVLPRVDDFLGSLGPMVQHVGRYGCDVINAGVVLRSMTGFTGTGEGPNGPSSQFRLQAAAGTEALGVKEVASFRDAYHPPCRYLGRKYSVTPLTDFGSPD